MTITDQFQQAADKATNASDIAHDWANGDENTEIPTESGLLPSIKKYMKDSIPNGNDLVKSIAISLANEKEQEIQSLASASSLGCAITGSGLFTVSRHLGGNNWLEYKLDNSGEVSSGVNSPYKVVGQKVKKLFGFLDIKNSTTTGTWYELNSNDSSVYTGHRSLRSLTSGDTLEWDAEFGGDLIINWTGDDNGGIAEVSLDGGEPVEIDMYSETPNNFNQSTTVFRDIGKGFHNVKVTVSSSSNPSSTGNQVWLSSAKIVSRELLPDSELIYPKKWQSGKNYDIYDEVINEDGRVYVAETSGVSGANEPTHTSGSSSDGGVDWLALSETAYDEKSFRVQAAGSELEYAYEIIPNGQSAKQDVGGNAHGNEFLSADPTVLVDGVSIPLSELDGKTFYGSTIQIIQNISQFYGDYATKTDIGTVKQIHSFQNSCMAINYKQEWLVDGSVGWYYSGMFPFLAYDGPAQRKQFATLKSSRASFNLADYENVSGNPILGNEKDLIIWAEGRAFQPKGSGGVPAYGDGETGVTIALKTSWSSVGGYKDSGIFAGLAVNGNAGEYTGYSSWLSKMYLQRIKGEQQTQVSSGDWFEASNTYYCTLSENYVNF